MFSAAGVRSDAMCQSSATAVFTQMSASLHGLHDASTGVRALRLRARCETRCVCNPVLSPLSRAVEALQSEGVSGAGPAHGHAEAPHHERVSAVVAGVAHQQLREGLHRSSLWAPHACVCSSFTVFVLHTDGHLLQQQPGFLRVVSRLRSARRRGEPAAGRQRDREQEACRHIHERHQKGHSLDY